MRASFGHLRLMTGELRCGGAHDSLTRTRSRLGDMELRSGRKARSAAGERRVAFLGRTQAKANVNYSSPAKFML